MAFDQNQFNQIFQSTLGRAPTQSETQFLQPHIESGTLSYDQAGKYLQSTPEALQGRLGQQQGQYQGLLSQNNQQILGQAADAANASFAQNGRQFSSGQGNAVLQAGQQLAAQQSPMLAQNYAMGQQGLNNAYNSLGQNSLQRSYDLTDSNTAWGRQQTLYSQQANDYQNLMRQQSTRGLQSTLMGGALGIGGGLLAGGLGSYFGSQFGSKVDQGWGPGTAYPTKASLGPSWNL